MFSKDCSDVIYRTMEFFSYLDHNLISMRKLSGMLCSSYAIHMFIELPNNLLQLLAKYEKSHDIMNFFQEENSGLLKKIDRDCPFNTKIFLFYNNI